MRNEDGDQQFYLLMSKSRDLNDVGIVTNVGVFFTYSSDIMPTNISVASDAYGHYNLMPVYGKLFEL